MSCYLKDFHILRPSFETSQSELLNYLKETHTQSVGELESTRIKRWIDKFCCRESFISKRGHSTFEPQKVDWKKWGFKERSSAFSGHSEEIFEKFYHGKNCPPDHLLHVTCTGYSSPSCAQKMVSRLGWGGQTTVTHIYHMGCMAALAAIRVAAGLATSAKSIDIVHTEICTLHANPSLHEPDQLIAQSLFGDGFIKYSLSNEGGDFRIVAMHEEMIPETEEAMKWECEDWGLKMTLSKEIPRLIEAHIESYLEKILEKVSCKKEEMLFALHPGGPKIIDLIGKKLGLSEEQLQDTRGVLFNYGNMSSATLPHIFASIAGDSEISSGKLVLGVAFGPGLTISGIVLEKV